MPGARIQWTVTTKLSPVKSDENPASTRPIRVRTTL